MTTFIGWNNDERYYYHHGHSAIAESNFAKSDGTIIYSIGLTPGTSGQDILDRIATPGKSYEADTDTLEAIFQEIAGTIALAATNASVTDPIGEKFTIPADMVSQIQVSQGTFEYDPVNEVITWNVGDVSESNPPSMTYVVEIDADAESRVLYPTNERTFIEYTNAEGQDATQDFPIPEVFIVKPIGQPLDISDYVGVYDGQPHSITINNLIDGDSVSYSLDQTNWSSTIPTFTDVVSAATVYVNVTNPSYETRTGSGTVTITPKTLTLTANSATLTYNGQWQTVEGFTSEGLLEGHVLTGITASGSGKDVGTYEVAFSGEPVILDGEVDVTENYVITLVPGTLDIVSDEIQELVIEDYEGVYDGAFHGITVGNLLEGDVVEYSLGDSPWWTYNPEFMFVGEYEVLVRVTNPNYEDRYGTGTVTILPRPLEITAGSARRQYNGTPLTNNSYSITGGSLAEGDVLVSVTVTGSQTAVGSSPNVASDAVILRDEIEGIDVTENYEITYKNGTLTITARHDKPEPDPPPPPPILNLADHVAYIQGYPDNTVRPEGHITREEVAAVFFRLLDPKYRELIRAFETDFSDVLPDRWSSKHIATLTNGNILTGYPDGTFLPGNYITRAELAAVASRFDDLSFLEENLFPDVEGHWAEKYINSAAAKGWVTGYPDGTFKPDAYITRAEFVTLVNRVLQRSVRTENILPDAKQFPDLLPDSWYYEAMQEAINSHLFERKEDGYEVWVEIKQPVIEMYPKSAIGYPVRRG